MDIRLLDQGPAGIPRSMVQLIRDGAPLLAAPHDKSMRWLTRGSLLYFGVGCHRHAKKERFKISICHGLPNWT